MINIDILREPAFPAHAGMNRMMTEEEAAAISSAFPAHAGMNRRGNTSALVIAGVPRARGDEPLLIGAYGIALVRSPRTRG